jgi:5'-deoxynucleotidase YfbR-like HD superfamily hydrolase
VAWLVLVLCPPELDRGRALAIAILHDLPEVRTGDITPNDGVPDELKSTAERLALDGLLEGLSCAPELRSLWLEYQQANSPEGRFVKACDKLDMALQAQRYSAAQGLPLSEFVTSALASLAPGRLRILAGG